MDFPLFDQLRVKVSTYDTSVTLHDKQQFVASVKDFDQDGFDYIYAIIYTFHYLESGVSSFTPYGSKSNKSSYTFSFTSFPVELQKMLLLFVELHKEQMTWKDSRS